MVRKCILFLLIFLFLVSCSYSKHKYPNERDTVDSFGDGTFQLLGGYDANGQNKTLTLFDMSKNAVEDVVANDIVDYEEMKGFVYFIDDQKRYLLLNTKQNTVSISTELDSYTTEQQQIFKSIHQ
ncbi:hypothetical protein [Cohnella yongneupensis]|uniref:Uncharacterized protein n=1 Tax=Cohnella yongneupensis TaxID=425006 RepID=A0ABW0QU30_9BACL